MKMPLLILKKVSGRYDNAFARYDNILRLFIDTRHYNLHRFQGMVHFFPVAVTSSSAPPYWNLRTSFITS